MKCLLLIILFILLPIWLLFVDTGNIKHINSAQLQARRKNNDMLPLMSSFYIAPHEAILIAKGYVNALNNELLNTGNLSTAYGGNGWVDNDILYISWKRIERIEGMSDIIHFNRLKINLKPSRNSKYKITIFEDDDRCGKWLTYERLQYILYESWSNLEIE